MFYTVNLYQPQTYKKATTEYLVSDGKIKTLNLKGTETSVHEVERL